MSNAKKGVSDRQTETIKVIEPPKIPMNFGKKPSVFSGGQGGTPKNRVVLPTVRTTQSKGAGSGK